MSIQVQHAAEHRAAVVQDCLQHARQDHRLAGQRKGLIESRKEYIETVNKRKVWRDS